MAPIIASSRLPAMDVDMRKLLGCQLFETGCEYPLTCAKIGRKMALASAYFGRYRTRIVRGVDLCVNDKLKFADPCLRPIRVGNLRSRARYGRVAEIQPKFSRN
jgi:hypothetical protein